MCHIFSSFLRHLICATSSNFTLSRRYFCDPNPFAEIREIIHAVSALASLWRDSSVNPITLSSQNPSFLSDPFLHPHFVLRFPLLLLFLSLCLYSISYINILVHPFTLFFFSFSFIPSTLCYSIPPLTVLHILILLWRKWTFGFSKALRSVYVKLLVNFLPKIMVFEIKLFRICSCLICSHYALHKYFHEDLLSSLS